MTFKVFTEIMIAPPNNVFIKKSRVLAQNGQCNELIQKLPKLARTAPGLHVGALPECAATALPQPMTARCSRQPALIETAFAASFGSDKLKLHGVPHCV